MNYPGVLGASRSALLIGTDRSLAFILENRNAFRLDGAPPIALVDVLVPLRTPRSISLPCYPRHPMGLSELTGPEEYVFSPADVRDARGSVG